MAPKFDFEKHLIDDWRARIFRLWSVRVALFWGGVSGLFVAWPSLAGAVPLPLFATGSVVLSVALVAARVLKQPGVSND